MKISPEWTAGERLMLIDILSRKLMEYVGDSGIKELDKETVYFKLEVIYFLSFRPANFLEVSRKMILEEVK